MSSLFISFEGGEGAGKSTQAKLLSQFLQALGHQVVLTREPGGTNLGGTIRELFLQSELALTPTTELFLLLADRSHHVSLLIQPALKEGKIVITDRFVDSTIAYQGFGHGLDRDWITKLNHCATGGLMPDITFWLDIDPRLGLARSGLRRSSPATQDRIEKFNLEFHQRVRAGFAHIWHHHPDRVHSLDGSQPPDQVFDQISRAVLTCLEGQSKTNPGP